MVGKAKPETMKEYEKSAEDKRMDKKELAAINRKKGIKTAGKKKK